MTFVVPNHGHEEDATIDDDLMDDVVHYAVPGDHAIVGSTHSLESNNDYPEEITIDEYAVHTARRRR